MSQRSRKKIFVGILLVIATGGYLIWKQTEEPEKMASEPSPLVQVRLPASLSGQAIEGKTLFDGNCAQCHGENAAGNSSAGPPLVHRIYEPEHHGDLSFRLAVQNGVRSHHWNFGNMPAQPQVKDADMDHIIGYIRELQKHNGIM